jgi:hypothetical protein
MPASDHVCGLMGFNPMKGDNCPACETPHPPREAPTPGTNPECANCGAYRCHHFGRAEYCNPTCLDRGEGATFRLRASGSGTTTAGAPTTTLHYVRRGKWMLCYGCGTLNAGEHYCGADWQTSPEGDGIDDASPGLLSMMRERLLAALLSSPPGPSEARESSG